METEIQSLSHLRQQLADGGYAFEGLVILFLLRTFCRPTVLSSVFMFPPDTMTQIVGLFQGEEVQVDALEIPPRYSLGVVYYAEISWAAKQKSM